MMAYILKAAILGAKYTAIFALVAATLQSIYWSFSGNSGIDGFIMLALFWVPPFAVLGAGVGLGIFSLAGIIVYQLGMAKKAGVLIYVLLGCILSFIPVLMFAQWVAGGIGPALLGERGAYQIIFPSIITCMFAGVFVGLNINRKPDIASET